VLNKLDETKESARQTLERAVNDGSSNISSGLSKAKSG